MRDGTVTSLLTFCDGQGKCFSQEWGPHLGDEPCSGDNTESPGPPCDGFNKEDYSYLPNGWTEALILSGSGGHIGDGFATCARGTGNYTGVGGSPTYPCTTGCEPRGCQSCGGYGYGCNNCGSSVPTSVPSVAPTVTTTTTRMSNIELKPLGAQV